MKTILTMLTACLMPLVAQAEAISWADLTLPVRANQWHQIDEDGRIGYVIGALQAAAYLNAKGDEQIGCVVGLAENLTAEMSAPAFSDMVVTTIADRALTECAEGASGTGVLISSRQLSEAFTASDTNNARIGFVVGMTEFFYFQTYAKLDDETADCVQSEALGLLTLKDADFITWTETPDDPFVEDALMLVLDNCDVS
ncbi:hypothetical protein [Hyphomonas johnsonii]|uniref:Lipoprotein n=1 Tax=Hyphomonas johnsonii MHS-2 TaxID=1280950 RepID=A0A059FJM0_9PROT|nr:hypothetical protein [Hyphomonas johnsonii]KCZ90807.1 hypothetical protein HJO_13186 [Hyphomonas johnsonii MHS-2]